MRLVSSATYPDVALSVYVKVKALGARPEGCQARAATIASYLGLSKASVERGLTVLSRPAPDGVIELQSVRRTLPGGRGTSAVRRTRPVRRTEKFVWLPVAAAEDLTPRQLRAYAVIAFAEHMGIALTEGELAGHLRHHSGRKAGQPITAAAAGEVVDELEAAKWVTVQRRAGAQGRHRFIAHDIAAPTAVELGGPVTGAAPEAVQEPLRASVDNSAEGSGSSVVGEGSGLLVGEGSLANREVPMTDSPEDGRALFSPAVGEVPVVTEAGPAKGPAHDSSCAESCGGLALRADEPSSSSPSDSNGRSSWGGESARSSYDGPHLTVSTEIYTVLEPVRVLLERVNNDFVVRKIAREVGLQLRDGTSVERLRHRLTTRFARVMLSDIRDAGRWLLGVGLPRWGCGHHDCESGVLWVSGKECEVCAELLQDKAAGRRTRPPGSTLQPDSRSRPVDRGPAADTAEEVAPQTAAVVCGVCRTARIVDSLSGVCDGCAQEMRGLLVPEMEGLNGDGERLLMRLVSGGAHQVSSRSWWCTVPSCGRRQTGVPSGSGRCAPCEREAAGMPFPWAAAAGDRSLGERADSGCGQTRVVPPLPAESALAAVGPGSGRSRA